MAENQAAGMAGVVAPSSAPSSESDKLVEAWFNDLMHGSGFARSITTEQFNALSDAKDKLKADLARKK